MGSCWCPGSRCCGWRFIELVAGYDGNQPPCSWFGIILGGKQMRVLICGGGVIGASIAYFLSCRGVQAVVIERTGLACAASGKSGGFLALDWCDGTPLAPLARRSFVLHTTLHTRRSAGTGGFRRHHL